MPSIEQNLHQWSTYDWSRRGAEWTDGLGADVNLEGDSSKHVWDFIVWPRIRSYLPAEHILELAPGYGLWTKFLRPHAKRMTLVDLAPNCIDHCRKQFGRWGMKYVVNDGKSLDAVPDHSVDFVYSLNALVHAEDDVMAAYVEQLGRKLKPGAFGFLHHSNLGEYAHEFGKIDPAYEGWHARSMTAAKFRGMCRAAGLDCFFQELIPWGSARLIGCYSAFQRAPAKSSSHQVHENTAYWDIARSMVWTANQYARLTTSGGGLDPTADGHIQLN